MSIKLSIAYGKVNAFPSMLTVPRVQGTLQFSARRTRVSNGDIAGTLSQALLLLVCVGTALRPALKPASDI